MKTDPMAIAAIIAGARILGGGHCMVALFIEANEADAVTRMVSDIIGNNDVRYLPPSPERNTGLFSWVRDGDDKTVSVNIHVLPASANDNRIKEG